MALRILDCKDWIRYRLECLDELHSSIPYAQRGFKMAK